ncbi:hypothetical protein [Halocatena halophila]|uniref:hypothetical protein n=1 Tax=Halocatena halophila TaxID=2814576 RepID=UPI002ED5BBF5
MTTPVHQLDDGAWISVNDQREMNISDLWQLYDHDFCACHVADVLAEGFVEVSVEGATVTARFAGQCINCGESAITGWLTMGTVDPDTETFRRVDPNSIHRPAGGSR